MGSPQRTLWILKGCEEIVEVPTKDYVRNSQIGSDRSRGWETKQDAKAAQSQLQVLNPAPCLRDWQGCVQLPSYP